MEEKDKTLMALWIDKDEELKRAAKEHQSLERKLEEFNQRPYLTTEETMEKKRIQKLKLAEKDKIMAILAKYR
ncbi:MAG: DUF465 domain-containing protein [Thermodesulfobacteriota bacterium]|nr:DUF465 domain-containing protein [Thermodesulfobacteriota bacterium]